MTKTRLTKKRKEEFRAVSVPEREDTLPLELRKAATESSREARLSQLKQQYLSGTYCVPTEELSAAIVEKHLKR